MQAVKKLKSFAANATIKEALIVTIGAVVGYKLVLTCFELFGITFDELMNTALGRPTNLWESSLTEIICVVGLVVVVIGITLVVVTTAKECVVAVRRQK